MTSTEQKYSDAIWAYLKERQTNPRAEEPKAPSSLGFRRTMTVRSETMALFQKLEAAK